MAAFRVGRITEWKATVIARESACLSLPQRREVDELVAADPGALEVLSDRELAGLVARHAYRLDPAAAVARRARAESERRVSLRPAPDGMTWLGALLPMKDGVGVLAALRRGADVAVAGGDPRGRGQLMADTLVARVTGAERADVTTTVVNLVVSDQVLAGDDESGGWVQGYGPVPSGPARELAADAALPRRLYANPGTGQMVAMEVSGAGLPARARSLPPLSGSRRLSLAVVRRPRRPPRPRPPRRRGRPHHRRQRPGPLPGLQPRQAGPRLVGPAAARSRPAHGRDPDPDRARLPFACAGRRVPR